MMVKASNEIIMNGFAVSVSSSSIEKPIPNGLDSATDLKGSNISLDSRDTDNSSGSSLEDMTDINGTMQPREEYEDMLIMLTWGPNDRRFGFSVFGGTDQDHPPRINKISFDSPATRAGLLLNDEILEINGISVEAMSHADVIMHIHKSKNAMKLKVRRHEDVDAPFDNGDGREMPIDVGPSTNEGSFNAHVNKKPSGKVLPQSGMLKYARTQPKAENVNRESNVPAKYYNEAFEVDDEDEENESSRGDDIPSKFVNEGYERDEEGERFVQVTSKRRFEIDVDQPKSFPNAKFTALLRLVEGQLNGLIPKNDVQHLQELYSSDNFISAVKTHNYMTRLQLSKKNIQECKPVATNSQFLLTEVRLIIMEIADPTAVLLLNLINKPEMQQLLNAHDHVARRETFSDSDFENSDVSTDDEEEDIYKIVRIDKTNEPLGATVRNEGDAVVISRIVRGGAAEKSGVLHVGDEILEINDESVKGKNVNDVVDLLAELNGTLTFVLLPSAYPIDEVVRDEPVFVVKALFDYDPKHDDMLPCEELGLGFRKGDVLEILNKTDPDWWQARLVNNVNKALAGLIPSKPYQLQREAAKITLKGEDREPILKEKKRCLCGRRKRKAKKESRRSKRKAPFQEKEVLTYEDMVKFIPDPMRKRPVVLIGPPDVGRVELKKRLIRQFPDTYASAIAHTTRLPSHEELSGLDYIFVSRPEFEKSITTAEFIEHGELEGHYYGTSFKAVRDVIDTGKTCILNLNCSALITMRRSFLLPYVIFITLPSINRVKQLRALDATCEPFNPAVRLKENEIDEVIEQARDMNRTYGHFFDKTIVNSDFDQTYDKVLEICTTLEKDPQWVPASWLPGG